MARASWMVFIWSAYSSTPGIPNVVPVLPTARTSSSQPMTWPSASRIVFDSVLMRTTSPRRNATPGTAARTG